MNSKKFKVIYTGQLKDGFGINQVAASFAIKFNLTPEKALNILQSDKEVTLNKGVEHVKAYGLKSALEDMGLNIKLKQAALFVPTSETEKPATSEPSINEPNSKVAENNENSTKWELNPIDEPNDDKVDSPKQQYNQHNEGSQETPNNKITIEVDDDPGFIKKFGGGILAIGAGLIFFLKKFGLFKLLKIGALVAVGASIGFNSEEVCLGNSRCEDAVDVQIDKCWEDNGFDDIDWDNITEDEYYVLKPKIEKEFIACFVYEDNGKRIFKSPIDLRFNMLDLCDGHPNSDCNSLVEPQIHSCYEQNNIGRYFNESTTDYYSVFNDESEVFRSFYFCFKDENNEQLFIF